MRKTGKSKSVEENGDECCPPTTDGDTPSTTPKRQYSSIQ